MRRSSTYVARIITIISLLVLISLSFVVLFQSNPQSVARPLLKRDHIVGRAESPTSTLPQSSTPPPESSPSRTSTQPSATPPPVSSSSSSPIFTPPTSIADTSSSSSPSSSSTSTSTSTSVRSTSISFASSSSSTLPPSSSSSSASSTSLSSSSTSSSSSLSLISSQSSKPTSVTSIKATSSGAVSLFTPTGISDATNTANADIPSDTAVTGAASSSNSFFKKTGAVAATFSIVGLAIVGIIAALTICLRRRRHGNEERDMFQDEFKGSGYGDNDGQFSVRAMSETNIEPLAHAAPHAYPDRGTHYGTATPRTAYDMPQTADYTLEYPPAIGGAANRDSTASNLSNHAGFGAFGPTQDMNQVADHSAPLHNSAAYDPTFSEPAVAEEQSLYLVSMEDRPRNSGPRRTGQLSSFGNAL